MTWPIDGDQRLEPVGELARDDWKSSGFDALDHQLGQRDALVARLSAARRSAGAAGLELRQQRELDRLTGGGGAAAPGCRGPRGDLARARPAAARGPASASSAAWLSPMERPR